MQQISWHATDFVLRKSMHIIDKEPPELSDLSLAIGTGVDAAFQELSQHISLQMTMILAAEFC